MEESAGEEEAVGRIEEATANAAEELQRLSLDGAAKVTNVKVTTDEREVFRRTQYFQRMEGENHVPFMFISIINSTDHYIRKGRQ